MALRKLLLVSILFGLIGCSALGNFFDAQARCAGDSECLSKVKGYAKVGEATTSSFGPLVVGGTTAVITFFGLGIMGLKKKKSGS